MGFHACLSLLVIASVVAIGVYGTACGKPKAKPWAAYTCDQPGDPYPAGTTCTYECLPGCTAVPDTTTAICGKNRKWKGPGRRWKCRKGCGEPPEPQCTERFGCGYRYKYGEKCYYRCHNDEGGYAMEVSGDPIRTCQKNGTWSGTDLVCNCTDRKGICCHPDIIFAIDDSEGVPMNHVRDFVADLADRFEIGDPGARVGFVRYKQLEFHLNEYDNKPDTLADINNYNPIFILGNLPVDILTYVANTMLVPGNGDRPDAPDVVIVVTDNRVMNDVIGPGSVLHSRGVQTFAISVDINFGSVANDAKLQGIANCPDHVYRVPNYDHLVNITDSIYDQICCDKPKVCPDNYVPFDGTCLRFSGSEDRQNFQQAQQTCRAEGARLVVIKSAALDALIDNRIQTTYATETWIGLDDLTPPAGQHRWSDGSVLDTANGDYSDWSTARGTQQPDGDGKCVEIRPSFSYEWNDHDCHLLQSYICEKVACPDNYVLFESTCLRFSQPGDLQSFTQAQQTCNAEGSRLVVIKSLELDAFIDNQIQSTPLGNTWIGLSTPIQGIPNQWTDGSTLVQGDYDDWEPFQTDLDIGETCTDIRGNYKWHTDNCGVGKSYICEHDTVAEPPCCPRP